MGHTLHVVDVFAERRFEGNPLSVVLDAGDLSGDRMQAIARETNHSETTFVTAPEERDGAWPVRIFTVIAELPFAGHPTLGTAWVIRHALMGGAAETLTLELGVGRVPVTFEPDAGVERAWLEAPPVELGPTWTPEEPARALGLDPADLDPRAPARVVRPGIPFGFVPVRSREALHRAELDPARLRALKGVIGLYLFCTECDDPQNQVQARMLFDAGGAREDPATGSATAGLGAYLLEHPLLGDGPLDLRIEQGRAVRRPSLLRLRARRTDAGSEIRVGGAVVPVVEGRLL